MDKDQKLKCVKRNTYRKLAVHLREVSKTEIRTQNKGSVLKINSFLTRVSQLLLKTIKAVEKLFLLRRRYFKTESLLRWLVAGLSPRRPYFDPRKSTWYLWWTKLHRKRTEFSLSTSAFPCQYRSSSAPY
jgi:hypothetical protein